MKLKNWIMIAGGLIASIALISCGGGGSDPLTPAAPPPPPPSGNVGVQGTKILSLAGGTPAPISFSFGDGAKVGDVTTSTYYEVTGTLANTGVGFGAVVAAFDVPATQKNWASATRLSIQLAGSETTRKITIELEKNGAAENGCNPFFEQTVTTELLTYNIDLTAANFVLPSFCTATAMNPALAGLLPDVKRITLSDKALPSTGTRKVGVRLGEIGVVGLAGGSQPPVVTPPVVTPPVVTPPPGTNPTVQGTKIFDFTGNTPAAISFAFGDGAKVGDVLTSTYYEVTGTLSNTGMGFGAVVAAFDVPAAQKSWASATRLSIQLAGSQSTNKVTIEIEKNGAASNGCNPFFEQVVTPQLTTYNIDLTAVNFALPSFCTADATNPAISGVLTDVKRISISDKALPTSGQRNVGVRLGEIGVVGLAGGSQPPVVTPPVGTPPVVTPPVVTPPAPTTTVAGVKILNFAAGTGSAFGFAFGDGVKVGDVTTSTYYEVTGTLSNTGVGFGAVVAAFDVPAAQKNWATASKLSIQLAGSQLGDKATKATNLVTIALERNGAASNGCNPSFDQVVTPQLTTYNIDLNATNFALPSFCSPDAANPSLLGVLTDVKRITVSDKALPTTGKRNVALRVGDIGVVGLGSPPPVVVTPPVVPPVLPPSVTTTVAGTKVLDFASGPGAFSFGFGGGTKVGEVTVPSSYYEVTGTLVPAGFGAVVAAFDPPAGKNFWTGATVLSLQIAGSQSTNEVTIELEKTGAASNGCNPSFKLAVTPLLVTYNITLNPTIFALPSFCTPDATNPALAGVMADVKRITVSDKALPTSGSRNVGIRLGEIGVVGLPALAPVAGTVILNQASGGGAFSFSFGDGNKVGEATVPSTSYEVTGTLANTGMGFGAVVAAYDPTAGVQRNWTTATKLSIQLAGSQTTNVIKIQFETAGIMSNGCVPFIDLTVTNQLTTYSIDLTNAVVTLPGYCGGATPTNPLLSGVLPNVTRIALSDQALPAAGMTRNVGIRVGNIGVVGL